MLRSISIDYTAPSGLSYAPAVRVSQGTVLSVTKHDSVQHSVMQVITTDVDHVQLGPRSSLKICKRGHLMFRPPKSSRGLRAGDP